MSMYNSNYKKCYVLYEKDTRSIVATSPSKGRIKQAKLLYDPIVDVKIKTIRRSEVSEQDFMDFINSPLDLVEMHTVHGPMYIPLEKEDDLIHEINSLESDLFNNGIDWDRLVDTMKFTPEEQFYIDIFSRFVADLVHELSYNDTVDHDHEVSSSETDSVALYRMMIVNQRKEEQ